ncbi:MAG TPA: hypothetical protein VD866_01495 [Urbifossiella sp.]|nr:hypothetical protein [Urbifossiella sp.]
MSHVIEADFGRRPAMTIEITTEVLYQDDAVMLVRSTIGSRPGDTLTTHFLAHRGGRVELIPVDG